MPGYLLRGVWDPTCNACSDNIKSHPCDAMPDITRSSHTEPAVPVSQCDDTHACTQCAFYEKCLLRSAPLANWCLACTLQGGRDSDMHYDDSRAEYLAEAFPLMIAVSGQVMLACFLMCILRREGAPAGLRAEYLAEAFPLMIAVWSYITCSTSMI